MSKNSMPLDNYQPITTLKQNCTILLPEKRKHLFFGIFLMLLITSTFNADQASSFDFLAVDFNESMAQTPHYNATIALTEKSWQQAKQLFDEHIIHAMVHTTKPRIPKIIHQIWIGSPLPDYYKGFCDSWIERHPDWDYILWTDKDIEAFNLVNKKRYSQAKNYGEKSDIARYEILERLGGLYVDTDFECLASFEPLHYCCDFYAGLNCETEFEVFNGLIASCPGHPILKECIEQLKKPSDNKANTPMSILTRTGPYFFTRCIVNVLEKITDNVVLFPTSYFYPWPHYARHLNAYEEINAWIRQETMAIHHWHRSWTKKYKPLFKKEDDQ